jgi:hypothetical protein
LCDLHGNVTPPAARCLRQQPLDPDASAFWSAVTAVPSGSFVAWAKERYQMRKTEKPIACQVTMKKWMSGSHKDRLTFFQDGCALKARRQISEPSQGEAQAPLVETSNHFWAIERVDAEGNSGRRIGYRLYHGGRYYRRGVFAGRNVEYSPRMRCIEGPSFHDFKDAA